MLHCKYKTCIQILLMLKFKSTISKNVPEESKRKYLLCNEMSPVNDATLYMIILVYLL